VRNLSAAEIVGQVMTARDQLANGHRPRMAGCSPTSSSWGMGEPLYNYDNVAQAMKIVMDGEGISHLQATHHALHGRRGAMIERWAAS